MKLIFDERRVADYTSTSQRARVFTEQWVGESIFCPNCGQLNIDKYPNNQPVADFHCINCREEYELKSQQSAIGLKVADGAYRTMVERLTSSNNPNFFLLNYDLKNLAVRNFFVIPKHFFTPKIIQKRKPLAPTARRSGWIGCNILLDHIPQTGKIFFVRNGLVEPKKKVLTEWKKTLFLRDEKGISARGWLLDTMQIIDRVGKSGFTLDDMYAFESDFSRLHPDNKHVKEKIRQQLQFLRDRGYVRFLGGAKYQRT